MCKGTISCRQLFVMGSLYDPVSWCKITYARTQVAQWHFKNCKGRSRWTGTSCFVLEVPLCNLRPSMCDFVPCDRIMQRAYQERHWVCLEKPGLVECFVRVPKKSTAPLLWTTRQIVFVPLGVKMHLTPKYFFAQINLCTCLIRIAPICPFLTQILPFYRL